MQIIKVALYQIIPYENNVKEHPQEQIDQIKKSIQDFGNNDPIALDENNVIIEGHGRFMALQQLGFEEAECIVLSNLSEDEKNAYRLVHNKLTMNSGFDFEKLEQELQNIDIDLSAFDFDIDEIMRETGNEPEVTEDEFDIEQALEEEPIVKQGELWRLGSHFLLCGDSTNKEHVSRLMQGKQADLLQTDPPYNVAIENSQGMTIENDAMNSEDFLLFLTKAFENAYLYIKQGAAFYIWYASREHINFEMALNKAGLKVRQQLIWKKNTFVMGRQDYHWQHEPCLYGWKEGSHNWYSDRTQTTILSFDKPAKNGDHPTMKPLDLTGYLINNSTKQGNLVLDLFGGSGSTLIACEQLNRICYTMELDEKYASVIVNRWEALTGKKAEKVDL